MKCEPQHLLHAAVTIAADAKDEAMFRAAINRAYYASYHCCIEYHASLGHVGNILSAKGRHEQLINQLMFPSKKLTSNGKLRSLAIGKYLRVICAARVHADYKLSAPLENFDMDEALNTAKDIFNATKITAGPPAL
jgi:hypothetical protein